MQPGCQSQQRSSRPGVRGLRFRDLVVIWVCAAQGANLFRMQRDDTFLRLMLTRIAALQVPPPRPPHLSRNEASQGVEEFMTDRLNFRS